MCTILPIPLSRFVRPNSIDAFLPIESFLYIPYKIAWPFELIFVNSYATSFLDTSFGQNWNVRFTCDKFSTRPTWSERISSAMPALLIFTLSCVSLPIQRRSTFRASRVRSTTRRVTTDAMIRNGERSLAKGDFFQNLAHRLIHFWTWNKRANCNACLRHIFRTTASHILPSQSLLVSATFAQQLSSRTIPFVP